MDQRSVKLDTCKNNAKMKNRFDNIKREIFELQVEVSNREDVPVEFRKEMMIGLREAYYQVSLTESLVRECDSFNFIEK